MNKEVLEIAKELNEMETERINLLKESATLNEEQLKIVLSFMVETGNARTEEEKEIINAKYIKMADEYKARAS